MDDKLVERINQFNDIKYGSNDNETKVIFATLKPEGTVTTAPNTISCLEVELRSQHTRVLSGIY